MRKLFLFLLLVPLLSFASEISEISLEGTLFKKSNKWFLFVESDKASFKKGTLELVSVPKEQTKFLIEKSFVQITGQQGRCATQGLCLSVKTIKLAVFDPLKDRKK